MEAKLNGYLSQLLLQHVQRKGEDATFSLLEKHLREPSQWFQNPENLEWAAAVLLSFGSILFELTASEACSGSVRNAKLAGYAGIHVLYRISGVSQSVLAKAFKRRRHHIQTAIRRCQEILEFPKSDPEFCSKYKRLLEIAGASLFPGSDTFQFIHSQTTN